MRKTELNDLLVGDLVVIKRGHNEGKIVRVVHIEDESILVKILPGSKEFEGLQGNPRVRLFGWQNLDRVLPEQIKRVRK